MPVRISHWILPVLACSAHLAAPSTGQEIIYKWDGQPPASGLGISTKGSGDVDSDGFPDVIVGENRSGPGAARIYSGRNGSQLYLFRGGSTSDRFGEFVNGAGDFDNDGVPDVIVGAHRHGSPGAARGRAYVYSGQNGSLLRAFDGRPGHANANFGIAVSGAGDANQDGFDDVLVGSLYADSLGGDRGSAVILSGQDGSQIHSFDGPHDGSQFGRYVDRAGDVDNDGVEDVIVAAPRDDTIANNAGRVWVFSGQDGSTLQTMAGESSRRYLGVVSRLGDVDDDGHDDVLIGQGDCCARVFSGRDGSELYSVSLEGDFVNVSRVGDIDGDGVPEFAAAGNWNDLAGQVEVFSGAHASRMFSVPGAFPSYYLGATLGEVGDVNRDGFADLLAGDRHAWTDGFQSGSAFVFSLVCGDVEPYGTGCGGSGGFTPTLSVSSCATPGSAITFDLVDARGGEVAWLIVGPSPSAVPLAGGCTLNVFPFGAIYLLPISGNGPGNGWISLTTILPITTPTGAAHLQAMITDQDHWRGFSMTNGVRLDIR